MGGKGGVSVSGGGEGDAALGGGVLRVLLQDA